ncbi:hypothetical protein F5Y17DRAFT_115306 [Xylariaceae sp. FL0594]|nr:hypothetical protein F5Y17DRAFT_115306 [Xylariaceae sp. FL0594]
MSSAATASAAETRPLSFMERLDPLVSVYRPSEITNSIPSTGAVSQPRLVIIASWTDAKDLHIAKYVAKYRAMYPAAQILLLKSTTSHLLRPSRIGPSMRHAAAIIRAVASSRTSTEDTPDSPADILVHIFSNGGSSSIASLYEQYAALAGGDDKRLPAHVTIYDSCPGVYSIARSAAFFNVGLSSLQRIIAAPVIYAWSIAWAGLIALGLLPDRLADWGRTHNEAGNGAEVRRVYIYSASDKLIDYKAVEAHAAEAKRRGFKVSMERFEGSAHVAHVRKDESRYWAIVRRIVEG